MCVCSQKSLEWWGVTLACYKNYRFSCPKQERTTNNTFLHTHVPLSYHILNKETSIWLFYLSSVFSLLPSSWYSITCVYHASYFSLLFGISPLLTFMYVSKFVWSLIASSIDYAADGRLFLDENEPWMFFWNILVFLSFYIYHSYERVNRLMMVCSIVIVDYRKYYKQKMSDFVSGIQWMLLKLLHDDVRVLYNEKIIWLVLSYKLSKN